MKISLALKKASAIETVEQVESKVRGKRIVKTLEAYIGALEKEQIQVQFSADDRDRTARHITIASLTGAR
jgi:hypothetical protein